VLKANDDVKGKGKKGAATFAAENTLDEKPALVLY